MVVFDTSACVSPHLHFCVAFIMALERAFFLQIRVKIRSPDVACGCCCTRLIYAIVILYTPEYVG